jgi:hypothetical protein
MLACLLLLAAPAPRAAAELAVELVATGLARPLFATTPIGDGRLFIVERAGTIRILLGGTVLATPFLEIRSQVSTQGERGLLGLAFPPDYPHSGLFYVYYTDLAGDSVLARFQVSDDPDVADPDSQENLLVVSQPFANHNGGTIAFGADGMLYWGLGDGGSAFDPLDASQDPQTRLGKMLRLDVSGGPGWPLAIPPDNPFVDDPGVLDEIWSFGLRNPYRWSFDRETGDMWIGDVGQQQIEEIDFEPADAGGRNYGWDVMEGTLCNTVGPAPPPAPACNDPSLTLPVFQYGHAFGLCSVTGGFIYRGANPEIQGKYLFGDFCTGSIFSYELPDDALENLTSQLAPAAGRGFTLVGFGEDGAGELYVVQQAGHVYRIRSSEPACSNGYDDDGDGLSDADDPACADPLQDGELPRNDLAIDVVQTELELISNVAVAVKLFGSERYDLSRADPDTVAFGPAAAPQANPYGPVRSDVNGDGHEDWTVFFAMAGSGLAPGDDEACVRVEIARVPFEGCDAVSVGPVEEGGGAAASALGGGGAASTPDEGAGSPVLHYVEASSGCSTWNDCGWLWSAAEPLTPVDGDAGEPFLEGDVTAVPALGLPGALLLGAALAGIGAARRQGIHG